MSTARTVSFEYSESPERVAELLQDPVYLRARSESNGERNVDVRVESAEGGVRVTVARDRPLDIPIPAFAKKAIGNANRAVESTLWRADGERWVADYTVDVPGLPVDVRGQSVLAPAACGCKYTSRFEVTVHVPLIAGRVEAMVAEGFAEQLRLNTGRNAEALKRSEPRGPRSLIDALGEPAAKARENV
jgi:hypothetical protein